MKTNTTEHYTTAVYNQPYTNLTMEDKFGMSLGVDEILNKNSIQSLFFTGLEIMVTNPREFVVS